MIGLVIRRVYPFFNIERIRFTIALRLFRPCIPHFLMRVWEMGVWRGAAIAAATLAISFGVAFVVFRVLDVLNVMQ